MPNTINSRQIFFVYNMTLTSYSIVTVAKDMAQSAGTGAWLTVLVTALIFSLAAACAAGLGNMYKEKMLFDYAPSLIGYPMTLAVVFFLILYFLFILVFLVTSMTVMTNANFLLDTPPWALAAFSIPLFCFIAYKGVTGAARIAEAVGIVFLVVAISVHAFMLTDSNLDWIRPFLTRRILENTRRGSSTPSSPSWAWKSCTFSRCRTRLKGPRGPRFYRSCLSAYSIY